MVVAVDRPRSRTTPPLNPELFFADTDARRSSGRREEEEEGKRSIFIQVPSLLLLHSVSQILSPGKLMTSFTWCTDASFAFYILLFIQYTEGYVLSAFNTDTHLDCRYPRLAPHQYLGANEGFPDSCGERSTLATLFSLPQKVRSRPLWLGLSRNGLTRVGGVMPRLLIQI